MDMPNWMKSVETRLRELDRRIRSAGVPEASVGVTNGTNTNAAGTTAYKNSGFAFANVNLTTTAALIAGAPLFTLLPGYRPPATIFATLVDAAAGAANIRVHVDSTGVVSTQVVVANGVILRGSFTVPLPVP